MVVKGEEDVTLGRRSWCREMWNCRKRVEEGLGSAKDRRRIEKEKEKD